jgi:hypothetical protein
MLGDFVSFITLQQHPQHQNGFTLSIIAKFGGQRQKHSDRPWTRNSKCCTEKSCIKRADRLLSNEAFQDHIPLI